MPRPVLLALRALGLGDLLVAVPALKALARGYPQHRRLLVASRQLAPLVEMSGAGFEVLDPGQPPRPADPLDPVPLGEALSGWLARNGLTADTAVNLHGSGPESHRALLATSPRRLVAYRRPDVPESADGPGWREGEHQTLRWCRLLAWEGIEANPGELGISTPDVPPAAPGSTLLHPGAASPSRRWPPQRWAEVARAERAAGREVAITGPAGEEGLAREVAGMAGIPYASVLAGKTDLHSLAATVAAAGRVVSGDTGISHLATALGAPSVTLFGPSPPSEWGPPPLDKHRVLWAGERGDPQADTPDPGLLRIEVADVLAELAALDESESRPISSAPRTGSRA